MITAGVDEVGRGCLAGPVVSAAVILKEKINLKLLKDSKKYPLSSSKTLGSQITTSEISVLIKFISSFSSIC